MKGKKRCYSRQAVWVLLALLLVLVVVAVALLVGTEWAQRKQINRELQAATDSQAEYIDQKLAEIFDNMRSVEICMENGLEIDSESEADIWNAIVCMNRLCTIAYSDLEGNPVSFRGERMQSIADRHYFSVIASGEATECMELLTTTKYVSEPRMLFSVPVYEDGSLCGVLFESKTIAAMEDTLMGLTGTGKGLGIAIVTPDDTLVMKNDRDSCCLQEDGPSECCCELLDDWCDDLTGGTRLDLTGSGYSATAKLSYNDWSVVCIADRKTAEVLYGIEHYNLLKLGVLLTLLMAGVLLYIIYLLSAKIRRKEAQLAETLAVSRMKIAASQMQPHFLYNALSSIREVVRENPDYASDLIYDFTVHLRACIRSMTDDSLITMEQELENIRAYIGIEKMRFGEKLRVQYALESTDFQVIPLGLQPFVENSVRHGIYERGASGGTVSITETEHEAYHEICIRDDGVGFDYEQVRREVANGTRDAAGIQNSVYRFETMLQAKVEIDSCPGIGTGVTIRIPKTAEETDNTRRSE